MTRSDRGSGTGWFVAAVTGCALLVASGHLTAQEHGTPTWDHDGSAVSEASVAAGGRATAARRELTATATVGDFAWLEGRWFGGGPEGAPADAVNETHYMAPAAGVIVGMMRLYAGDELMVIELFDILEGESGLEMRLRHFGEDLTAWETEGPLVLYLVEYDGHRSVWSTAADADLQIRTEMIPGVDRYRANTLVTRPDGSEQVIESVMERR